jgi:CheY-like chemotaxis protein
VPVSRTLDPSPRTNISPETFTHNSSVDNLPDPGIPTVNILVAEDNTINQELIRLMLKKMGYHCDVAENGKVVIEMLRTNTYHVVLMDCQMPLLDGYQTTQEIRQQAHIKDIIIIGLTAYATEQDYRQCITAGMNDYLSKPYTFVGLQEMLLKWIAPLQ